MLQHLQGGLRLIIRYHYNVIAIEALERSCAQVHAGRFDPDKHRGTAIWAGMKINFVGCEAKEPVRRRHIALLRSIQPQSRSKSVLVAASSLPGAARSVWERHNSINGKGGPSDRPTYYAVLSHLVSVGMMFRRYALHWRGRVPAAACRCQSTRRRTVMGSNTQALVKGRIAGLLDSLLCKYRGYDHC